MVVRNSDRISFYCPFAFISRDTKKRDLGAAANELPDIFVPFFHCL